MFANVAVNAALLFDGKSHQLNSQFFDKWTGHNDGADARSVRYRRWSGSVCGPADGVSVTGATTLGSRLNLGLRIGTAMQP